MAAFPLPALRTQVPQPLYDVMGWCRKGTLTARFGERSLTITVALHQLEEFLNTVWAHRGPIRLGADTGGHSWPTPYDALTYFKTWRTEIAVAVSQLSTPTFFDPLWLTGDVIALRDAIEAQRAFDRLPILADALEEAGCENQSILGHLRDPGDHAHHCWVIDLLSCGSASPSR